MYLFYRLMEGYREDELGLSLVFTSSNRVLELGRKSGREKVKERKRKSVLSITGSINIVTITRQIERERANYDASPLESQGYIVTRERTDGRTKWTSGSIRGRSSAVDRIAHRYRSRSPVYERERVVS